ncbi:unnamed protein product [Symbiodinium natans]|uniref:Uncharacterized protein n=1 Tax=Symbiodinium natans TaxID=878477 RepID=A0A812Q520_9DINO|nr:unnamed protein product [Symbiodinium natans]
MILPYSRYNVGNTVIGLASLAVLGLESRIADERRQLDITAASQLRTIEDRLRLAEENARQRLHGDASKPGTKAAANLSKAVADLDARCESVRVTVGAVQSGLAEVQQKQAKTAEVEALVAQAREELRRECQERKAEGSQLSMQLVEHAERLEWAEQQRVKASNELLQEVMDTRSELKREMRDREEGNAKVIGHLRDEAARREEALQREVALVPFCEPGLELFAWVEWGSETFPMSFPVIAKTSSLAEFRILRWSKAGWWWAKKVSGGQQGWIYSSQMGPKMCTECREKVQSLKEEQPGEVQGPQLPTPEELDQFGEEEEGLWPPLPPMDGPTEVWPPLPPGSPPRAAASDPASREDSAFEVDYAQTLSFRGDGRVVPKPQDFDHMMRQADYYFDYKGWTDSRNTGTSGKKRGAAKAKVKATGDGGMKRRR